MISQKTENIEVSEIHVTSRRSQRSKLFKSYLSPNRMLNCQSNKIHNHFGNSSGFACGGSSQLSSLTREDPS